MVIFRAVVMTSCCKTCVWNLPPSPLHQTELESELAFHTQHWAMRLPIPFLRSCLLGCLLPDGFPSRSACGPCCRQVFHLDIRSTSMYCRLFVSSSLNSAPWSPRGLYVSGPFCTKGCSFLLCADYSWIDIITLCSPPLSFALLTSSKSLLLFLVLALSLTPGKGEHCGSSGQS